MLLSLQVMRTRYPVIVKNRVITMTGTRLWIEILNR